MRRPPAPKLVTVAIVTTITVVFWVFLGVYNILVSKETPVIPPELLNPIDSSLDTETLNKLQEKMYIEEGQESSFPIIKQEQ